MGVFRQKKTEETVQEYFSAIDSTFKMFRNGLTEIKDSITRLNQIKGEVSNDPELTADDVSDIEIFVDSKVKEVLSYIVSNIDNAKLKTMLEDITGTTITIS